MLPLVALSILLYISAGFVYSQPAVETSSTLVVEIPTQTAVSGPASTPLDQVKLSAEESKSMNDFIRKVDYGTCSALGAYRIFDLNKNRACLVVNSTLNATTRLSPSESEVISHSAKVQMPGTAKLYITDLPNITDSEETTTMETLTQQESVTLPLVSSVTSATIPTQTEKAEDILDESFEDWLSHHAMPQETVSKSTPAPNNSENAQIRDNLKNDDQAEQTPKETVIPAPKNPIIHPKIQTHGKDRFNFASFDCGAIIKSSNPGSKSATSILSGNKDSYMLNQCKNEQYVIVELCEEILIDTIVLANLELFSSMFKDVRISISNEYQAGKGWTVLANFLARNVRNEQSFVIPNPVKWTKYVKIEFLSHYGSEFFCPVTLLRVFGKNVMEDLRVDDSNTNNNVEEDGFTQPPRRRPPASSGVIEFKSPILQFEKDINTWLENFEFPYSEYSNGGKGNSNNNPPSEDTSKESVLKSILKRLTRLEQNMTLSQAYLSLQHKKLQEIYKHLDTSVHSRVDLFLQKLTEQVVEGMQSITSEYETVLDSWISDLTVMKKQMKQDIVYLKSRVQFLMGMISTLFIIAGLFMLSKLPRIQSMWQTLKRAPSEDNIQNQGKNNVPKRRRTTELKIKTVLPPIPKMDATPVSAQESSSLPPATRKNSQQGKSTLSKRRNSNRRKRRNSL